MPSFCCSTCSPRKKELDEDHIKLFPPYTLYPGTLDPQSLEVGTTQKVKTSDDTVMDDLSKQRRIIADMDADKDVNLKDVATVAKDVQDAEIKEITAARTTITAAALQLTTAASTTLTTAASTTLTTAPSAARRRKGVVIRVQMRLLHHLQSFTLKPNPKRKGKGFR
nr:hypothetical protein [Tanacetum cinerariifolium]